MHQGLVKHAPGPSAERRHGIRLCRRKSLVGKRTRPGPSSNSETETIPGGVMFRARGLVLVAQVGIWPYKAEAASWRSGSPSRVPRCVR
jgi:hypothetical protein